jgi:acetyl esterase
MAALTPESEAFLRGQGGLAPWPSLTPVEARAQHIAARRPDSGAPDVAVTDRWVPGSGGADCVDVAVRVYGEPSGQPVIVFAHGGGWVYGDLDMADGFCRRLSVGAGVVVCSVDYRLSPEHPYPEPLDDMVAATRWASKHLANGGPVGVAGSSAGGNLAVATTIRLRDSGEALVGLQVPMCAVMDFSFDTPSYLEHGSGKFLSSDDMRWYWAQYLSGGVDGEHALLSVLRADHFDLPPALVITAEHDPLRDEGEHYAHLLLDAGVPVQLSRHTGMLHAFPVMSAFPTEQARVIEEICRAVDTWLR